MTDSPELVPTLLLGQASIVGKRYGRHRWFDLNKTVEGSVAFALSVVGCAEALYLVGALDQSPVSDGRNYLLSPGGTYSRDEVPSCPRARERAAPSIPAGTGT